METPNDLPETPEPVYNILMPASLHKQWLTTLRAQLTMADRLPEEARRCLGEVHRAISDAEKVIEDTEQATIARLRSALNIAWHDAGVYKQRAERAEHFVNNDRSIRNKMRLTINQFTAAFLRTLDAADEIKAPATPPPEDEGGAPAPLSPLRGPTLASQYGTVGSKVR